MQTITRQQFIDAVEAGITEARGSLTETERALLRHVARTEKQTLTGTFGKEGCFCPLSAAGITDGQQTNKYVLFWMIFDSVMRTYGISTFRKVQVVG